VAGQDDLHDVAHLFVDVVIVGAGPAGCAAALWAASEGLSVCMLHRPDRRHYSPGETLHPAIEPLLRQLGAHRVLLDPGVERHEGHFVEWNCERRFQPFGGDADGPWRGFHVCRQVFDGGLRTAAALAGVVIHEVGRVDPMVDDHGTVIGVRHDGKTVSAGIVIDAAGAGHWLSRALGLPICRRSPRLVARYGLVSGERSHDEPLLTADSDGWTWTAPVADGTIAWVRLPLDCASSATIGAPAELASIGSVAAIARGADVTWRSVTPVAGPGYVMVGDAAFVLDPLSSHGVMHAIMSGMMAADMIAKHLVGRVPIHVTQAAYIDWSSDRFNTDIEHLRSMYAQMPNPPEWAMQ
jgi:flavin-dependent dehydrogenase